ncbi:MAG: DUF6478 family protein [Pseudomonadota bacterium]
MARRLSGLIPGRRTAPSDASPEAPNRPIPQPPQCDWAWRPAPWVGALPPGRWDDVPDGLKLAEGVRLFHDCPLGEIVVSQTGSDAPGLVVAVGAFEGSFLSLAMDMPHAAATSLRRSHIVGIAAEVDMDGGAGLFARLNIRQGPNTDQMVGTMDRGARPDGPMAVAFDLGFDDINPAKLSHAWIDVIFGEPRGMVARIADLTLTRRPRADI